MVEQKNKAFNEFVLGRVRGTQAEGIRSAMFPGQEKPVDEHKSDLDDKIIEAEYNAREAQAALKVAQAHEAIDALNAKTTSSV